MSKNGYVPKWLCPETVKCPEVAMSRNGYVPKRPAPGTSGPTWYWAPWPSGYGVGHLDHV